MSAKKQSLKGKRFFITGVGRRINDMPGIGERLVYALVERGAQVFLTGIDKYELTRVTSKANRIGWQSGGHAYCTYCDVRDLEQVTYAVKKAVDRMGGLDVFVANAGIAEFVVIEGGDPELFMQHVMVNYVGVFNTIHACAPFLDENGYGLVNSSQAANVALPGMAPGYGSTKAAAKMLAEGYNLELRKTGARCGVICLAEHESPMEAVFETDVPQLLMEHNRWLKRFHRARKPEKAVKAIVRGIERRSLYIDAPFYAKFARFFPAITNWAARLLVQNPQPAMAEARLQVWIAANRHQAPD